MKKLLYVLCLFLSLQTKAQTGDSLRDKLNSIFYNIDKTQIPTEYLTEYGTEFTPLHWYNGVLTDSSIVFNLDIFKMIYADLETAKILPSAPGMAASETTDNTLDSLRKQGTFSLAVLLGSYSILKPTAITENLLSYDNRRQQFNDVPGRTALPYLQKTVFAVSPT